MATAEAREEATSRVELDQTRVGRLSRMDALQGQAMAKATGERAKLQLQRIATALRRIEAGEYGECTSCSELIDPRRLEVDPAAPRCIVCADK